MNTRHFATTRQTAVAGLISRKIKEISPNPPLRHRNQQGSISARAVRLLALYAEDMRVRCASRTADEYVTLVRGLLSWLFDRRLELADVRTQDLLAYQEALYRRRKRDGRRYSLGSQANHLKAMKSFFRFLFRRLYLLSDPAASVDLPRLGQTLPPGILSEGEARRILEAPDGRTPRGLRDRAMLELLYATGLRVSELTALRLGDVDTEERVVRVIQGKGRKDRHLPLTRLAARAIAAYLRQARPQLVSRRGSPWLFAGGYSGRLSRPLMSKIVREWTKAAKVKKRVTCHSFRHTLATHLLRHRADLRHIQTLLGHATLATTERYTRVEISDLRKVLARAHPRGR